MKKLIQLLPMMALLAILTTSKSVLATDCPNDSLITITLEDYKYIQVWAEFGLSCEEVTDLLESQIIKDGERVDEMSKELDKSYRKQSRLKVLSTFLGSGLAVSIIYIIFN